MSEADVRAGADDQPPGRGFTDAIKLSQGLGLIAEVKKASPSEGLIRADFDPVVIAKTYEKAGATCLSVLTDRQYFMGSTEDLQRARAAVSLPVLRKDFIVSPYQVYESRAMGADAVLLIAAALEGSQMSDLYQLCRSVGLDVLVEVHDESEVARAVAMGSDLIGVNNRDLATFTTDIAVTERLMPLILPHASGVCESGLGNAADVDRARRAGAKAVLIGTAFCRADDPAHAVKEIMSW